MKVSYTLLVVLLIGITVITSYILIPKDIINSLIQNSSSLNLSTSKITVKNISLDDLKVYLKQQTEEIFNLSNKTGKFEIYDASKYQVENENGSRIQHTSSCEEMNNKSCELWHYPKADMMSAIDGIQIYLTDYENNDAINPSEMLINNSEYRNNTLMPTSNGDYMFEVIDIVSPDTKYFEDIYIKGFYLSCQGDGIRMYQQKNVTLEGEKFNQLVNNILDWCNN